MKNINSFNSEQNLEVDNKIYKYFDLKIAADKFNINLYLGNKKEDQTTNEFKEYVNLRDNE